MGSILARRRKDGTTAYTAQIRLKRDGVIYFSQAETFDRRALATEWLRRREAELDQRRARGEPLGKRHTLGDLVTWYREEVGPTAEWGRTKEADLLRLANYAIAKKAAVDLTVADFIDHAHVRRAEGAGPATIGNDLIWVGQVLRSARSSLDIPARLDLLQDARYELRQRKMIAKSKHRDRRLTADEELRLTEHFRQLDRRAEIPMLDLFQFALASARREDEICRLKRVDLDRTKGIAWLDDVKHPRDKKGNRQSFRLLPEAWAIIDRQPPHATLVFPFNPKSVGTAFARACKFIGIQGLTFHDLRHEATSRLFERGYAIQEVAQFTLHKSWETLRRYTHLRPEHVAERPIVTPFDAVAPADEVARA